MAGSIAQSQLGLPPTTLFLCPPDMRVIACDASAFFFLEEISTLFTIRYDADIRKLPDPTYIFGEFIPSNTLTVIHGQPGIGKSLMMTAWGCCLACGIPWYGLHCKQGRVINVLTEGWDAKRRHFAWRQQFNKQRISRYYAWIQEPVNLYTQEHLDVFVKEIDTVHKYINILILDTMNSCSYGSDENSSRDMGRILESCRIFMEHWQCNIFLIHHPRKNDDTYRGHSSLMGAVDLMFSLEALQEPYLRLTCEKNRGGPLFDMKLQKKVVDTPWGSSAIVIPGEGDSISLNTVRPSHGKDVLVLLNLFKECPVLTFQGLQEATGKGRSQLFTDLAKLKNLGLITKVEGGYQLS